MNTPSMCIENQTEALSYERPQLHHLTALQDFFSKSLHENFYYFPAAAHTNYQKAWQADVLKKRLEAPSDLLCCAWHDKQIVGFISGSAPEGGVATIIWLTVAKQYQNRRIGAALLNIAKNYYEKTDTHKIKLTVHDKKALQFYLREGFIQEAQHQNHWWNLDFWSLAYFIHR